MGRGEPEDLHPDDVANLFRVRAQLQALADLNVEGGVSKTAQAARVGRSHWFLHILWSERTWPGYWKFSTFHDLCVAVGCVPAVTTNLARTPMTPVAEAAPRYWAAALQEALTAERWGSSVQEVASKVQVSKSAVWRTENSDDPRLSTLQRYARAYDCYIRFGIGETP